jgi:hypothetical protein
MKCQETTQRAIAAYAHIQVHGVMTTPSTPREPNAKINVSQATFPLQEMHVLAYMKLPLPPVTPIGFSVTLIAKVGSSVFWKVMGAHQQVVKHIMDGAQFAKLMIQLELVNAAY